MKRLPFTSLTILLVTALLSSASVRADRPAPAARQLLPLIFKGVPRPTQLLQPADLHYLGAFRLPGGDIRPETFDYGGNAMTFNPAGDAGSPDDGYPGSLYIMGHDRLPYGELPNGNQVAEASIPTPVDSRNLAALPRAGFVQPFHDIAAGAFAGLD